MHSETENALRPRHEPVTLTHLHQHVIAQGEQLLRMLVNQAAQKIVLDAVNDHGESIAHTGMHVHHLESSVKHLLANQLSQTKLLEALVATSAELSARIDALGGGVGAVSDQLGKATTEILAQIAALKAAIEAGAATTPEIDAKLATVEQSVASLKAMTEALDALNPDATVPDPDPVPPTETPAQAQARRARGG